MPPRSCTGSSPRAKAQDAPERLMSRYSPPASTASGRHSIPRTVDLVTRPSSRIRPRSICYSAGTPGPTKTHCWRWCCAHWCTRPGAVCTTSWAAGFTGMPPTRGGSSRTLKRCCTTTQGCWPTTRTPFRPRAPLTSPRSRVTPPSSWRRCSTTMRVADFTAARTPILRRATTAATSPGRSTRPGPCSATTNFPCWLSITTCRGGERCTTILPGMCSMWTGIQTSWPRSCTGTSPTSAGCSAAAAKNLSPPAGNGRCRTSITPATQTGTAWPLPRSSTRL